MVARTIVIDKIIKLLLTLLIYDVYFFTGYLANDAKHIKTSILSGRDNANVLLFRFYFLKYFHDFQIKFD